MSDRRIYLSIATSLALAATPLTAMAAPTEPGASPTSETTAPAPTPDETTSEPTPEGTPTPAPATTPAPAPTTQPPATQPPATPTTRPTGHGPTQIRVLCDGIGEDVVTVVGNLAAGGRATITSGPLKVVGQPGFRGHGRGGAKVAVESTGTGSVCTAQENTEADDIDELLPASQAEKTSVTGEVEGALTFTVEVDESQLPMTTMATTAATALPFESELRSYLNGRPGAVGVAVRLPGTDRSWTYTKWDSRNVTASIVKVEIMAAVMMRAQDAGRSLSSWEKSKIVPMIRYSDNSATTDLFNHIGGRDGLQQAGDRLGMSQTVADPAGHWGLTVTTAYDQAELMEHFARPSSRISYSNRQYGLYQMDRVSSSQDWGVSAGPGTDSVALKNGWLPRYDGWHVNSIGWQHKSVADYTIAVLTHHDPGAMSTQITTIEGVSRIIWKNRLELLPPKERGVRGDNDGDGRADLMGTSATGRVYVMPYLGSGQFGDKTLVSTGLADADWFGPAGDVNFDGRSDVLVRREDGRLQLMLTASSGALGSPRTIATGWQWFVGITGGGDVDDDGRLDIIARRSNGEARRYTLTSDQKLVRVGEMGTPFYWYPEIRMVGDVDGDGRDDIRGFSDGGRMRTFTSTGTSWRQLDTFSDGWDEFRAIAVPGDVNATSTNQDDIVVAAPDGTGYMYLGSPDGELVDGRYTVEEYLGSLVHLF